MNLGMKLIRINLGMWLGIYTQIHQFDSVCSYGHGHRHSGPSKSNSQF